MAQISIDTLDNSQTDLMKYLATLEADARLPSLNAIVIGCFRAAHS